MKPSKFTIQWLATGAALALALTNSHASYSSAGQGMQTVLSGTVDNGALYMSSTATWINATPSPGGLQPYTNTTVFPMPQADSVVLGRLIFTEWGAMPSYTNTMDVTVNGTSLLGGTPLSFGTTTDANASFSAMQPSVYGAGTVVWLVSLPVPAALLHLDGSPNTVQILETLPTSDGRISQVSLLSVYQNASLNNQFQYAIAEGSGDIYRTPATGQTDSRTVSFGGLALANPTAATLSALYTYGDSGQNDRLFFNGTQLGGDDIATWGSSGKTLAYGPDVVSEDVLSLLGSGSNDVRFSVSAADVPGTRESSLRPQIATLGITQTVPEPSAVALVVISLGGLSIARCRRQA
jgi:hypothetical protein